MKFSEAQLGSGFPPTQLVCHFYCIASSFVHYVFDSTIKIRLHEALRLPHRRHKENDSYVRAQAGKTTPPRDCR